MLISIPKSRNADSCLISAGSISLLFRQFYGLFLIFLLFAFQSCSSHPGSSAQTVLAAKETVKPRIAFLMMRMTRDSIRDSHTVELIRKTIREGSLKLQQNYSGHSGEHLTIEVLEDGMAPATFSIKHPLIRHAEFEKDNELVSREIRLNSSEFFIRLQVKTAAAKVNIYEKSGKSERKRLFYLDI